MIPALSAERQCREGSILLTVMVVVSILSVLIIALLSMGSARLHRSGRYGALVQARWLAEGEAEYLLAKISSGLEPLEPKEIEVTTELGDIFITIERSEEPREYRLRATADVRGVTASVERGLFAFYASDFAVSTAESWQIISRITSGSITGRIYVGGDLLLAADEDGSFGLAHQLESEEPHVTLLGNLDVVSLEDKSDIVLVRTDITPYDIEKPWREGRGSAAYLIADGRVRYRGGDFPDIESIPQRQKLHFPEFNNLYARLLDQSEAMFRFMGNDTGRFGKREILNPKLLTKDLLAVGNGTQHIFRFSPADRQIPQIYMRRVREGQIVHDIIFDPVADADAVGNRFFTARMGTLHLPGPNTRMYIQMDESAFHIKGRFYFGTQQSSYSAVDHPLTRFSINTAGEDSKYQEGRDFFVNTREKYLEFTSYEFLEEHYAVIPERGDGYRLGFTLPERTRPKFVYVNGVADNRFTIEENTLFFHVPPPDGAEIAYMIREPRVFAQKDPPGRGVGIFTDRILEVMEIDLSTMRHYPGQGLILTDKPVVVTGNARFPVSIASTEDIYIDNINADASDPRPVGIFSGGNVWIDNASLKTNVNMRVFIHSEGERIYTTTSESKSMRPGVQSTESATGIIVGSVHLAGRTKNGYFNYPESMTDPAVEMYSDEPFFTVQYRHDPAFLDPENLPPGIAPQVKILWWKR